MDILAQYYPHQAWTWDFFMSIPEDIQVLRSRGHGLPQVAYVIARLVLRAFDRDANDVSQIDGDFPQTAFSLWCTSSRQLSF